MDALTTLAAHLVDSPQAVPMQLHVAPAGWQLDVFKDDGRFVRLAPVEGDDPYVGLDVRIADPAEIVAPDRLPEVVPYRLGQVRVQVRVVTVQGQTAHLVPTQLPDGTPAGWYLQAPFADGTAFVVEAPAVLAAGQVAAIADGVTNTP